MYTLFLSRTNAQAWGGVAAAGAGTEGGGLNATVSRMAATCSLPHSLHPALTCLLPCLCTSSRCGRGWERLAWGLWLLALPSPQIRCRNGWYGAHIVEHSKTCVGHAGPVSTSTCAASPPPPLPRSYVALVRAVAVYEDMANEGCTPSPITYKFLLQASSAAGRLDAVLKLHQGGSRSLAHSGEVA